MYRMSPLKNVFGSDGVDKFEEDDKDDKEFFVQPRWLEFCTLILHFSYSS